MKFKNYRHGDMALIGIAELPNGVKKSKTKNIMKGSHENDHSFDDGILFLPKSNNDFVIGYLEAKNTTLLHLDHGEELAKSTDC